jgi:hypothetical protein
MKNLELGSELVLLSERELRQVQGGCGVCTWLSDAWEATKKAVKEFHAWYITTPLANCETCY